MPAPGGDAHAAERPRPADCASATTTVPSGAPRSASVHATSLVEPTSAYQRTRRANGPSRRRTSQRQTRLGEIRPAGPAHSVRHRPRLNLEAEVGGGRRVRQRADRHVVGAGRGQLRHPRQRDAAGDLRLRAARGTAARASMMSGVDRLSSRMMSAPARSASSTCSRLCASTSIGISRFACAHPRSPRRTRRRPAGRGCP